MRRTRLQNAFPAGTLPYLVEDALPKIGAPATRALASIGVTRLSQLVDHRTQDLLALHGFGPRAINLLQVALDQMGLSFRAAGPDRQESDRPKP